MILITGASGKTGREIIRKLANHNARVRAFVHNPKQVTDMLQLGATEVVVGNILNPADLTKAFSGINSVYAICPNMHPEEVQIGLNLIRAAQKEGVKRFVFHSVLRPQISDMPHHWSKLKVEEILINSNLNFTILQPGVYMQNIFGQRDEILQKGVYPVPYAISTRLSLTDLNDIAHVAAKVLLENNHDGAIYELVGPEALMQTEVADIISQGLNKPVIAQVMDRDIWANQAKSRGLEPYALDTLMKMFEYYEQHGLVGNSRVLEFLLEKPATNFNDFVINDFVKG